MRSERLTRAEKSASTGSEVKIWLRISGMSQSRVAVVSTISAVVIIATVIGVGVDRFTSPTQGGPLGEPGDAGLECVYAPPKASVSYGAAFLVNSGDNPALIESVKINQLHNLRLVDVPQVVHQTGNIGVGVDNHYPPEPSTIPGVEWPQRTAAVGSSIPGPASIETNHNVFDLVVAVTRTGMEDGSFSGVTIQYHVGHRKYIIHTKIGVIVYRKPCGNDSPDSVPYPPTK